MSIALEQQITANELLYDKGKKPKKWYPAELEPVVPENQPKALHKALDELMPGL